MTEETKSPRFQTAADVAAHFKVSRETIEKFEAYADILRVWQKTINLVAPSTIDDVWHRHFADSAQLAALAPQAAEWVDLGSGAGFPGMVAAILCADRPGFRMTLIESDTRKAAFLREVARITSTRVEILSIRVEKSATQFILPLAGVVSARALAPLPRLFRLAAPLMSGGATGLFPKGRDVEHELEEARRDWSFHCELVPSLTDADARIAVISHLAEKKGDQP